jgi:5-methylcytosine-specific restriction endonuclease McrA
MGIEVDVGPLEGLSSAERDGLEDGFEAQWPGAWVSKTVASQRSALESGVHHLKGKTLEELTSMLPRLTTPKPPRSARAQAVVYDRSPIVVEIAKRRAGLRCEVPDCQHEAFKKVSGEEYVEVHHIVTLSDGGLDTPANVVCLCPSHHMEAHHGQGAESLRRVLQGVRRLDADDE